MTVNRFRFNSLRTIALVGVLVAGDHHRAVLDDRPGLDGQQPAWFQELDHVRSLNPDPMLFGPWMGEA